MMCIKYSENIIICVLKVRHKIHHLYIPHQFLTFGGYKQTDLNSFLLPFSLSLLLSTYLSSLSPYLA